MKVIASKRTKALTLFTRVNKCLGPRCDLRIDFVHTCEQNSMEEAPNDSLGVRAL